MEIATRNRTKEMTQMVDMPHADPPDGEETAEPTTPAEPETPAETDEPDDDEDATA
jgi:hypothetical protein